MDKINTQINIFLDLSKAFDTLDYKILLDNLDYFGFNGVTHKAMQCYINYKKQYVKIEDFKSDILTLTTGVPQGSILGLLLYIY